MQLRSSGEFTTNRQHRKSDRDNTVSVTHRNSVCVKSQCKRGITEETQQTTYKGVLDFLDYIEGLRGNVYTFTIGGHFTPDIALIPALLKN